MTKKNGAKIGLSKMAYAKLNTADESIPSYSEGIMTDRPISYAFSPNTSEANLYAGDVLAESLKELTGGGITLGSAEFDYDCQKLLLGRTMNGNELVTNVNDKAPYVGVGLFGKVMRLGTVRYRCIWFYKVIFSEPSDEVNTKGQTTEFQTGKIEGTIMPINGGDLKTETIVDTEADAIAWLKGKAAITSETEG